MLGDIWKILTCNEYKTKAVSLPLDSQLTAFIPELPISSYCRNFQLRLFPCVWTSNPRMPLPAHPLMRILGVGKYPPGSDQDGLTLLWRFFPLLLKVVSNEYSSSSSSSPQLEKTKEKDDEAWLWANPVCEFLIKRKNNCCFLPSEYFTCELNWF